MSEAINYVKTLKEPKVIAAWLNDKSHKIIDCYTAPSKHGLKDSNELLSCLSIIATKIKQAQNWDKTSIIKCIKGLTNIDQKKPDLLKSAAKICLHFCGKSDDFSLYELLELVKSTHYDLLHAILSHEDLSKYLPSVISIDEASKIYQNLIIHPRNQTPQILIYLANQMVMNLKECSKEGWIEILKNIDYYRLNPDANRVILQALADKLPKIFPDLETSMILDLLKAMKSLNLQQPEDQAFFDSLMDSLTRSEKLKLSHYEIQNLLRQYTEFSKDQDMQKFKTSISAYIKRACADLQASECLSIMDKMVQLKLTDEFKDELSMLLKRSISSTDSGYLNIEQIHQCIDYIQTYFADEAEMLFNSLSQKIRFDFDSIEHVLDGLYSSTPSNIILDDLCKDLPRILADCDDISSFMASLSHLDLKSKQWLPITKIVHQKMQDPKADFSAESISKALYGLRHTDLGNHEVHGIIGILIQKIDNPDLVFDTHSLSQAFLSLSEKDLSHFLIQDLLEVLRQKLEHPDVRLNDDLLHSISKGLSRMDPTHEKVLSILDGLAQKLAESETCLQDLSLEAAATLLSSMHSGSKGLSALLRAINDKLMSARYINADLLCQILSSCRNIDLSSDNMPKLLSNLEQKIRASQEAFSEEALANAIYGLKNMNEEHDELLAMAQTLSSKIDDSGCRFSAISMSKALYSLKNMTGKPPETAGLFASLARIMSQIPNSEFTFRSIGNCIYGLQSTTKTSSEAKLLLQHIKNAMMAMGKLECSPKNNSDMSYYLIITAYLSLCLKDVEPKASPEIIRLLDSDDRYQDSQMPATEILAQLLFDKFLKNHYDKKTKCLNLHRLDHLTAEYCLKFLLAEQGDVTIEKIIFGRGSHSQPGENQRMKQLVLNFIAESENEYYQTFKLSDNDGAMTSPNYSEQKPARLSFYNDAELTDKMNKKFQP